MPPSLRIRPQIVSAWVFNFGALRCERFYCFVRARALFLVPALPLEETFISHLCRGTGHKISKRRTTTIRTNDDIECLNGLRGVGGCAVHPHPSSIAIGGRLFEAMAKFEFEGSTGGGTPHGMCLALLGSDLRCANANVTQIWASFDRTKMALPRTSAPQRDRLDLLDPSDAKII